jgi:ABC-type transport system involved in cytochrome c biogenesis permease subunit
MSAQLLCSLLFSTAAVFYAVSCLFYLLKRSSPALWLLGAGFAVHSVSQVVRCWRWGFFSLHGVFVGFYFLPWCLALLALLAARREGRAGASLALPTAVVAWLTVLLPVHFPPPKPFTATLASPLCFAFEALAVACFLASGWFACRFLSGRKDGVLFNRLATWGFICFSLAQVFGAIWFSLGWSGPFQWSSKNLRSIAIWCLYCAYLHTHFDGWFGVRKKAWWVTAGALLVLWFFYASSLISHAHLFRPKPEADRQAAVHTLHQETESIDTACRRMLTAGREVA